MKRTLCSLLLLATALNSFDQNPFNKLKDLKTKKILDKSSVLKGKDPITTSLDDAKTEAPELDNFDPVNILPGEELPGAMMVHFIFSREYGNFI